MKFKDIVIFTSLVFILIVTVGVKNTPPTFEQICKDYGVECSLVRVYTKDGKPNAFSKNGDGTIYIKNDMDKKLSKSEWNSILYHELAHIVLQHSKRMKEAQQLMKNSEGRILNKYEWCHIKREQEYEADAFTVEIARRYGVPSHLDEAFIKLFPKDKFKEEYCTHPSFNRRVKYIRELEKKYNVGS